MQMDLFYYSIIDAQYNHVISKKADASIYQEFIRNISTNIWNISTAIDKTYIPD